MAEGYAATMGQRLLFWSGWVFGLLGGPRRREQRPDSSWYTI